MTVLLEGQRLMEQYVRFQPIGQQAKRRTCRQQDSNQQNHDHQESRT